MFGNIAFILFFVLINLYAYFAWVNQGVLSTVSLASCLCISLFTISRNEKINFPFIILYVVSLFFIFLFSFRVENGLYTFIQLIACSLIFFSAISRFKISNKNLYIVSIVCVFNVVFIFLMWNISGRGLFKPWVLINLNPNVLGFFVFLNLYFIFLLFIQAKNIAVKTLLFSVVMVSIFIIFVSGARTSLLSLFLSIFFFFLFRKRKIKYRNYILMVLLYFIFMPVISYGYVLLYKASFSQELNQYVWEETGKSLFTGRQEIWATIFDSISDNFIFGLGLGAELSEIGITVSSHNLYLMLIYQLGIVGLVFFIIYFLSMTKIMFNELYVYNDFASSLSISWVMAIMVHQGFEIFLFQNNLAASFLFWFILCIPFSKKSNIEFYYETNTSRHG